MEKKDQPKPGNGKKLFKDATMEEKLAVLNKLGIKMAPDDHPIYSMGPTVYFYNKRRHMSSDSFGINHDG